MVWLKARGRAVLIRDLCGTMITIGAEPVELKKPAEDFEHDGDLEIVKKPRSKKAKPAAPKKPPAEKPVPAPEPPAKPKRRGLFSKKVE